MGPRLDRVQRTGEVAFYVPELVYAVGDRRRTGVPDGCVAPERGYLVSTARLRWLLGRYGTSGPGCSVPGRNQLIALLVILMVGALTVSGLLRLRADTTVSSFLPEADPSLVAMNRAASWFGGDPIVILAESAQPRQLLGPDQLPKLLGLEGHLATLPDVAVVYGPGTVLNQIAQSAQNLLATITGSLDRTQREAAAAATAAGASPAAAAAAGQAAGTQFDQRYAALLARGLPAGLPTLHNPGFVNAVVFDQSGAPRSQWRFVVPSPNALAILIRPRQGLDQAGTARLVTAARAAAEHAGLRTTRLTVSGSPTVAAELGQSVQREVPLLGGLALLLIGGCYLLVPWTRRRRRLLPLLATLSATALILATFGWLGKPLSLGVITFLPIVIGIGSDFPAYLMHGGAPRRRIVVVALAGASGFASLALSPLPFVRDLGVALAAGVLLAVAIALGLRRFLEGASPEPSDVDPAGSLVSGQPDGGPSVERRWTVVLAATVLVAAIGWLVLPRIAIEADPTRLAEGLPAVVDAQHTEQVLGSSGELDILLRGNQLDTPDALGWMRRAENSIVLNFGSQLRPIVTLPDLLRFLGPNPTIDQMRSALSLLPDYLAGTVLSADHDEAVISLGLSLQDLGRQQSLIDAVRASLPPPPHGTSVDVVGLPVVAARAFTLVSEGRYLTNLAGILAAGLVLLIGLRDKQTVGRAVLAAILATGWGLAATWLFGIALTPLSVALGSLTTATACEFTVLLSYAGAHRVARLRRTVGVSALAAALGYVALAPSQLAVIRDFGLLLAASVGLSLLAAHLVVRSVHLRRPAPTTQGAVATAEEVTLCDSGR